MRNPPPDLVQDRLAAVVAAGWGLRAVSLAYMPEGGGSHHWKLVDDDRQAYFVTVDDLDDKDWFGSSREAVFDGLRCALTTAATLRYGAGLDFVMAPIATRDGQSTPAMRDCAPRHVIGFAGRGDLDAFVLPERDVSLVVTASNEGIDRYQQATGRELRSEVITLYRLRWYLDDVASAVRLFRNAHHDTRDTRRRRHGLRRDLEQLPRWRDLLS